MRRLILALTVGVSALAPTVLVPTAANAAVAVPKAPVALPVDIEPMPPYQPQTYCDPHDKPGVVAFGQLLTSVYRDTSVVSISRPCGTDTDEGRPAEPAVVARRRRRCGSGHGWH